MNKRDYFYFSIFYFSCGNYNPQFDTRQSENVKSKQEIAIENSVNEDEKYLDIILDENIIDTLSFLCKQNFDSFKDNKADFIDKNLFTQSHTFVFFISRDDYLWLL